MRLAKSYEGYEFDETKAYEKGGKLYVHAARKCDRCTKGVYVCRVENGYPVPHPNAGGVCFKCGGTGFITKECRLYTDEERKKLDIANERAAKKRELEYEAKIKAEFDTKKAEWLEKNGFNEKMTTFLYFPEDSYEVKEELKKAGFRFSSNLLWHCATVPAGYEDKVAEISFCDVAELAAWGEGYYKDDCRNFVEAILNEYRPKVKSNSKWVFEEKDRFRDYEVTLKSIRQMETKYGWTQLFTFEDKNNDILQWWTSVAVNAEVGDLVLLSGTVKEHTEYKGEKITTVNRCKVKKIEEE